MKSNPYFLLLPVALFCISCQKEEPAVPEFEPSSLNIHLEGDVNLLHGQESIRVSVEDANSINVESISFYLDDQLIVQDKEAPFELTLLTDKYEDGDHQLKIQATTASKQLVSKVMNVNISNVLMKVRIDPEYFSSSKRGDVEYHMWAFLSDKEGKLLGKAHKLSGHATSEEFIFKRPKGYVGTPTYNRFSTFQGSSTNSFYWYTTEGINFKEYDYGPGDRPTSISVGEASVEFSIASGKNMQYNLRSRRHYFNGFLVFDKRINIPVYESQEKLIATFTPSPSKDPNDFRYHILNIKPNNHYTIKIEEGKPADKVQYINFSDKLESGSVSTYWKMDGGAFKAADFRENSNRAAAIVLPAINDAEMEDILIFANYTNSSKWLYMNYPYTEIPNTVTPTTHEVELVNQSSNAYEATITGTPDVVEDYWRYSDGIKVITQRNYKSPVSLLSMSLVPLPDTLASIYKIEKTWPAELQEISTTDYENLNGYSDYLKALENRATGNEAFRTRLGRKEGSVSRGGFSLHRTYPPTAGGRVSSKKASQLIRDNHSTCTKHHNNCLELPECADFF